MLVGANCKCECALTAGWPKRKPPGAGNAAGAPNGELWCNMVAMLVLEARTNAHEPDVSGGSGDCGVKPMCHAPQELRAGSRASGSLVPCVVAQQLVMIQCHYSIPAEYPLIFPVRNNCPLGKQELLHTLTCLLEAWRFRSSRHLHHACVCGAVALQRGETSCLLADPFIAHEASTISRFSVCTCSAFAVGPGESGGHRL